MTAEADAVGVSKGYISVRNPKTGSWATKPTETTFFPTRWSKRQTMEEIKEAFANSKPISPKMWEGTSPSGVKIRGYYKKPEGLMRGKKMYLELSL